MWRTAMERFGEKCRVETGSGCWLWTAKLTPRGYGSFWFNGRLVTVHRWLYARLVGPIGKRVLDHLCRARACVNPFHLEPVTVRENTLRGHGPTAQRYWRRRRVEQPLRRPGYGE